jgi:hypothetical protein
MPVDQKCLTLVLVLIFLIVGCNPNKDHLPTEVPIASSTYTPTRAPSETPVPPTAIITPTITLTEFVLAPNLISTSPDGTWTAKVFDLYPTSTMDVIHSDGTIIWNIFHDGEVAGWDESSLRPVHWSVDGKFLYYTVLPFMDGFILFNVYAGLGRLNLETGETEVIFNKGRDLYALAISPDSSYLAYICISEKPRRLVVREMLSGKEEDWIINDRYSQAGTITWAPDSSKLLFQVAEGDSWETVSFSLALVSLTDSSYIEFLQNEAPRLKLIEWLDLHTVLLEDWDQNSWILDISTGILTSLPTPTSSP